ncbi:UNVERIFIED_CONTAM: hypothetical protein NCL1_45510 [Trichonephila clavipes]
MNRSKNLQKYISIFRFFIPLCPLQRNAIAVGILFWSNDRSHLIAFKEHGHGSRVAKVSDRGWPCHEFKPSTTNGLTCVGKQCTLNM